MTKLLILTDLHITEAGQTIIGLDPLARLQSVLSAAVEAHPDAAFVLMMGDLTHHGTSTQYARLREVLETCPIPVLLMIGNHDRRATFRAAFPDTPATDQGFIQQVVDFPHHRLILLDSHDGGDHPDGFRSGLLCPDRLAWLDAALAGSGDRLPIVACHHPPFSVGLPGMDAIRLQNEEALLSRLADHGAYLLFGHIHRTISGTAKGVGWSSFKSPCHQAPIDFVTADSGLSIDEPGGYGIALLDRPAQITIHHVDVGLETTTMSDRTSQ